MHARACSTGVECAAVAMSTTRRISSKPYGSSSSNCHSDSFEWRAPRTTAANRTAARNVVPRTSPSSCQRDFDSSERVNPLSAKLKGFGVAHVLEEGVESGQSERRHGAQLWARPPGHGVERVARLCQAPGQRSVRRVQKLGLVIEVDHIHIRTEDHIGARRMLSEGCRRRVLLRVRRRLRQPRLQRGAEPVHARLPLLTPLLEPLRGLVRARPCPPEPHRQREIAAAAEERPPRHCAEGAVHRAQPRERAHVYEQRIATHRVLREQLREVGRAEDCHAKADLGLRERHAGALRRRYARSRSSEGAPA
ncbi:hypothetical protein T492DRAFT_1035740 [Pavlovales sp. CCMP2436]|nr:hypothetical protein T492DRAFT_1035740 [Pavlovales sp. CCMP2436]